VRREVLAEREAQDAGALGGLTGYGSGDESEDERVRRAGMGMGIMLVAVIVCNWWSLRVHRTRSVGTEIRATQRHGGPRLGSGPKTTG